MTALDRFQVKLECPQCGVTGVAKLSQADGYSYLRDRSTSVEHMPTEFSFTQNDNNSDYDIQCTKCGVSAKK